MNPTVVKVVSLVAGVALAAIAVFGPGLQQEARAGLLVTAGFLLGYPVAAPGGAGKVGILLLALCLPPLTACSSSALPSAEDVRAEVADARAKAAELAKQVEETRAKVEAAKQKALKTAKDTIAMVAAARSLAIAAGVLPKDIEEQTGIALGYASSTLAKFERGEPVAKEELISAIDAVGSVVRELRKLGREVQPLVDSSLDLVRAAVEGGG